MAVSVEIKGFEHQKHALRRLIDKYINTSGSRVEVGILPGGAHYDDGTLVATVAAAHEFGASISRGKKTWNIPQRSFLRATAEKKKQEWVDLMALYLKSGKGVDAALHALGEVAHRDVQHAIEQGIPPKLKPSTIERKTKKGFANPTLPLVETGLLQRSIAYRVVT